jgi:hypothetical protein
MLLSDAATLSLQYDANIYNVTLYAVSSLVWTSLSGSLALLPNVDKEFVAFRNLGSVSYTQVPKREALQ